MDAVKFVEERRRMFAVSGENPKHSLFNMNTRAEDVVKEVAEWSATHPRKTRQSVFLEQYPNARIDRQAVIYVCPADAYGDKVCPKNEEYFHMLCPDCRREFWMQEVE